MYQSILHWFYYWQPEIITTLLNWFPMLLLIAVWVYFLKKMNRGKGMSPYERGLMDEMSKQSEALARIAAVLEKKAG